MTTKEQKTLDRQIERVYGQRCHGIQIDIWDIGKAVSPEVKEVYDALIKPSYFDDAKREYEKLRERIIAAEGYETFRARQSEAFIEIVKERCK